MSRRRRWMLLIALVIGVGLVAVLALQRGSDAVVAGTGPATPDSVARGAYLARVGNCGACHTQRGGLPFAGGRAIETPFGTVYASNLTPDVSTGIGAWTRDDFWRALHEGRSRDGRLLTPAFPYPNYTMVARADADAIYDYLRSMAAVKRPNTPHRLRWPYSTQAALVVWRALYFTPAPPLAHAPQDERQRGEYLVQALSHCSACHTPRNAMGANSNMMDLSGGLIPMQNWYAPSLTSPREAGVANWELREIERLLGTGIATGAMVEGPMAEVVLESTQYLTPQDLRAMALFLRSLPQSASAPATGPRASKETAERGARVYRDHCAGCHGDRGEGVRGAYPALAGSRAVTMASSANLVHIVLEGGFPPETAGNRRPFGMPPFATLLDNNDVADLLGYIRSSWGNAAGAVTPFDVSQYRAGSARP